MCTPWTMTRLVRWRVRDWASCFLSRRFPTIDDHKQSDRCCSSKQAPLPMRTKKMVFDTKEAERSRGNTTPTHEAKRKLFRHRKSNSGVVEANNITNNNNNNTTNNNNNNNNESLMMEEAENRSEVSNNWPHFVDEEYIVFCFGEDGAFEVEKNNGKSVNHELAPTFLDNNIINPSSRSSRPVNRKLNYEENTKTVLDEERLTHGQMTDQKDEEENIFLDSESVFRNNFEEHRVEFTESSESTHSSDASSGSFAFPALSWELIGSPERMPKSEGLRLRKHRSRCVGFQCWRF